MFLIFTFHCLAYLIYLRQCTNTTLKLKLFNAKGNVVPDPNKKIILDFPTLEYKSLL